MPTNLHVNWWSDTNEQNLLHDLMTEAIKFYGLDVYYLPRNMRREDTLYNEDILSQFTQIYPIEVYLKNVAGWDGQGNFLNKFGLNIEHTFTVMVSVDRFNEIVPLRRTTTGVISANGGNTLVSGVGTHFRNELRVGDSLLVDTGVAQVRKVVDIYNDNLLAIQTGFDTDVVSEPFVVDLPPNLEPPPSRPMEGDWVYIPAPIDKTFEVKFVENEKAQGQFYPLGTKTFYEMSLESFTYTHEEVRTGDPVVDTIELEHAYSQDLIFLPGGTGEYVIGETVYQGHSIETAAAKGVVGLWDPQGILLRIVDITGEFAVGLPVKGSTSGAVFTIGKPVDVIQIAEDNDLDDSMDPLNISSNRMLKDFAPDFIETEQENPFKS